MTDPEMVEGLYGDLLRAWNRRAADDFTALFAEDGHVVGFDGSPLDGAAEIASSLRGIFADHPTARYIGIVRGVQLLGPDAALLLAVAGMVPRGQSDLNPAVNAIQSLVAVKRGARWRIAHFQNTPAAFHGRPHESEKLTAELRAALEHAGLRSLDQ